MTEAAGFFGKLPSHGDFVNRRVSREFLEVWDEWLQHRIAASKVSLGDRWLDTFLTSPIWRFAISPDVCDGAAYIGAIMPSVDRVGRYFPLTIVSPLPEGASHIAMLGTGDAWFARCEELLLSVLSENAPQLENFDQAVASMPLDLDRAIESDVDLSGTLLQSVGPHSIWWTPGADASAGAFLSTQRLPDQGQYLSMLSGGDSAMVSQEAMRNDFAPPHSFVASEPAAIDEFMPDLDTTVPPAGDTAKVSVLSPVESDFGHMSLGDLINTPAELSFSSAAVTDTGKVRRENEDAILDKSVSNLWLVADGMGGHAAGKTASAAVVSAVDQIDLPDDIDGRISAITRSLEAANRELRTYSIHNPESRGLGSTVAVMTVVGNTAAIIWAGDTRVYRKRGHQLEQLTTDHSERQEMIERGDIASILGPSNVITRAVGGEDSLRVSTIRQSLRAGDRFLMCSDGIYEEIPIHELVELLEEMNGQVACQNIIDRVNEGAAADNSTALVVDVYAA